MLIVAIDWSKSKHDAALIDPQGKVLERLCVAHDAPGLGQLAARIAAYEGDPAKVRVAFELHEGALLAWLLEQKYQVFGINPFSAKRARQAYRPAGAKDDRSDPLILGELLRLQSHTLRPIRPQSPATLELLSLVQLRRGLVQDRTAALQRLRAILGEWCPALERLCDQLTLRWQQDLLARFPLHQDLVQAPARAVRAFLARHRLGQEAQKRLEQARQETPLPIPQARLQALRLGVEQLLAQNQLLSRQIAQVEELTSQKAHEHPDAAIFESLPVMGESTLAHLLAGFGQDRQAHAQAGQLAAAWGVAPITIASGKSRCVCRRRVADWTMGQALLQLAFCSLRAPGCWARVYYDRKRAEGKGHFAALRCLAQRWLKVLFRMWKDNQPYDEQRYRDSQLRRQKAAPARVPT